MGFSKKSQVLDGGLESEGGNKKWVIAGISVRVKPIKTKVQGAVHVSEEESGDENEAGSITPKEARIPEKMTCPAAPRKRRPTPVCNFNGVREYFIPPDLETVFKLHVEKAN